MLLASKNPVFKIYLTYVKLTVNAAGKDISFLIMNRLSLTESTIFISLAFLVFFQPKDITFRTYFIPFVIGLKCRVAAVKRLSVHLLHHSVGYIFSGPLRSSNLFESF